MITILTDSCSDLSEELLNKYNISVIPLNVILGGKSYKDGTEVKPSELFAYVNKTGQLPKTSAASVEEFCSRFRSAEETIFIGIGSKLSATIQSAEIAKQSFPEKSIEIVDSQNLSTGIGLLVLKAAELRDAGLSSFTIVEKIRLLVPKIRTNFLIDTLDYLYKGGRCSALTNIIGSILKIRPVIEVRNGSLGVKAKVAGTRKKALDVMLHDFQLKVSQIDLNRVFITHTGAFDDAEYLKRSLLEIAPIKDIPITEAGATISSHCGPNTIGILYLEK